MLCDIIISFTCLNENMENNMWNNYNKSIFKETQLKINWIHTFQFFISKLIKEKKNNIFKVNDINRM